MGYMIGRYELKPGDHIYAPRHRGLYSHHGIYVGDEMVIHFTQSAARNSGSFSSISSSSHSSSRCRKCGYHSKASGVIKSCLDCFLDGWNLHLFEYGVEPTLFQFETSKSVQSDPADRVIDRAESLLRNGFGTYNTMTNNCEHFAVYCKTGCSDHVSGQVALRAPVLVVGEVVNGAVEVANAAVGEVAKSCGVM